jgi:hypothetical protein
LDNGCCKDIGDVVGILAAVKRRCRGIPGDLTPPILFGKGRGWPFMLKEGTTRTQSEIVLSAYD